MQNLKEQALVDFWACCDLCGKWRRLPGCSEEEGMRISSGTWRCVDNKWDLLRSRCSAPEENPESPQALAPKSPIELRYSPEERKREAAVRKSPETPKSKQNQLRISRNLGGIGPFTVIFTTASTSILLHLGEYIGKLEEVPQQLLVAARWVCGFWINALGSPLQFPVRYSEETTLNKIRRVGLIKKLSSSLGLLIHQVLIVKDEAGKKLFRIWDSKRRVPVGWRFGGCLEQMHEDGFVRLIMHLLTDPNFDIGPNNWIYNEDPPPNGLNTIERSTCQVSCTLLDQFLSDNGLNLEKSKVPSDSTPKTFQENTFCTLWTESEEPGPNFQQRVNYSLSDITANWRVYAIIHFVKKGILTSDILSEFVNYPLDQNATILDLANPRSRQPDHPLYSRVVLEAETDQPFLLFNDKGDITVVPFPIAGKVGRPKKSAGGVSFADLSKPVVKRLKSDNSSPVRSLPISFGLYDPQNTDFSRSVENDLLRWKGPADRKPKEGVAQDCVRIENEIRKLESSFSNFRKDCTKPVDSKVSKIFKPSEAPPRTEGKATSGHLKGVTSIRNVSNCETVSSALTFDEKVVALYVFCQRHVREKLELEAGQTQWTAMSMWCPVVEDVM